MGAGEECYIFHDILIGVLTKQSRVPMHFILEECRAEYRHNTCLGNRQYFADIELLVMAGRVFIIHGHFSVRRATGSNESIAPEI